MVRYHRSACARKYWFGKASLTGGLKVIDIRAGNSMPWWMKFSMTYRVNKIKLNPENACVTMGTTHEVAFCAHGKEVIWA